MLAQQRQGLAAQLQDALVQRGAQLPGRAFGDHPAVAHKAHAVAAGGFIHVGGGDQHTHTPPVLRLATSWMINCQKSWRVTGSTPVVGSSSSSTRGRVTRAEASPVFASSHPKAARRGGL